MFGEMGDAMGYIFTASAGGMGSYILLYPLHIPGTDLVANNNGRHARGRGRLCRFNGLPKGKIINLPSFYLVLVVLRRIYMDITLRTKVDQGQILA